jgi:hypothetical protein
LLCRDRNVQAAQSVLATHIARTGKEILQLLKTELTGEAGGRAQVNVDCRGGPCHPRPEAVNRRIRIRG